MGHRALVAYRRPDRLYDLRYSHWGGDELSVFESLSVDAPLAGGRIDSDLLADSVALDSVLTDYLDPCGYEALILVSPEYEIRAYRVCWLEWGDGREQGRGALVAVEPGERDFAVRTWFRATKTVLADVVEMGVLSRRAAQSYLETRIAEDENGYFYTYGDADGVGVDDGPADAFDAFLGSEGLE
ncbi:DUF6735 family protein [Natronosalvus halobius]|uniref:DUF6735 family protein n=1 Tax=Natronosalvus halobius TaxID=2953746 RepID=UPI00209DAE5C|nr:DUF6735 family protein [Natronosalvus halobius]USZ72061.1 hypothetical protein NGM15_01760 [Natronosalvus halobius]